MKETRKKTKRLAFSAILCALGVLMLLLGAIIDVLDLSVTALASLLIVIAFLEFGSRWACLIYAATSLLALLLLPNKFPAFIYAVFAGYYPILKAYIERLPRIPAWSLKVILFNAALTLLLYLSVSVFHLPDTGAAFTVLTYLSCNALFLLFDIALTRLISLYLYRLRKQLGIGRFLE